MSALGSRDGMSTTDPSDFAMPWVSASGLSWVMKQYPSARTREAILETSASLIMCAGPFMATANADGLEPLGASDNPIGDSET